MRFFIHGELQRFLSLSRSARILLASAFLFNIAGPLLSLFVNTWIFRNTQSFSYIAFYNLAIFAGMPLSFYINGLLKKRYSARSLFIAGIITQGLVTAFIFLTKDFNPLTIFLFGFLQAFPAGLYWGNRNTFTQAYTKDEERNYYVAIEQILSIVVEVSIPFLMGWFIAQGGPNLALSTQMSYAVLTIVAIIFLLFSAWVSCYLPIKSTSNNDDGLLMHVDKKWKSVRFLQLYAGFYGGLTSFLSTMIVLYFLGEELIVGSIQSVSAIASAFLIYFIVTRISGLHRGRVIGLTTIAVLAISAVFMIVHSPVIIVIYLVGSTAMLRVLGTHLGPVPMKILDHEFPKRHHIDYRYILDQELFLNIGRVSGTAAFIVLLQFAPRIFVLTATPFISSLILIILFGITLKLDK